MMLESYRMLDAGAKDVTIGLNAMIAALALDGSDQRPANVTIYNAADHPWVARKSFPANDPSVTLPAFVIAPGDPADIMPEVETIVRDGHLHLVLAHISERADSAFAARDGMYVGRAALRFLKRFNDNANIAFRTRNGIVMRSCTELRMPAVAALFEDRVVTAPLVLTYLVRESAP